MQTAGALAISAPHGHLLLLGAAVVALVGMAALSLWLIRVALRSR